MPDDLAHPPKLHPTKFRHPDITADGEPRAAVALTRLRTLWFNTGTLCNLTCVNCYIDSSPVNDRLAYMSLAEVETYLDEIRDHGLDVIEIAFTGGEPFMNPQFMEMVELSLVRGFEVLILTNAMKPMTRQKDRLLALHRAHGEQLTLRVSIDHPTRERHEELRGPGSWAPMMAGVTWLAENGFKLAAAGRNRWGESEAWSRQAYGEMFTRHGITIDAGDPLALVLFPEMDETLDVPEITTSCWEILGVTPDAMMCATSRMVIKRKGAAAAAVVPCTLLPYDPSFDLGPTLAKANGEVSLNHPHCARFCVLGGASCSAA